MSRVNRSHARRDLLRTGQTTVTTILVVPVTPQNPTRQVRAFELPTTGLGSWAPSRGTVLYQNDHNDHIHVQLSYIMMLFIECGRPDWISD